ncbi:MAG: Rrf2 family transcriptional regulator [Clostridium sp.]|uniref:RrF2 family transcriptional regulator n=1 Tax=Clostridium sp. TaxID=1506 RepID=UPI002FC6133C
MRISTKGRYGIEAILDMALYGNGESVSIKSISERQGISQKYLEHIFSDLRKNGIVEGTRGGQGGYKISKDISRITVGKIIRSLEGSLSPVKCLDEGIISCEAFEKCVTKDVWKGIKDEIEGVVDNITIKDLVQEYESLKEKEAYKQIEYFI